MEKRMQHETGVRGLGYEEGVGCLVFLVKGLGG